MPKVSICVPAYQNLEDVKRLTDSVKAQSFRDYELIITDDSRDNNIENYISKLQTLKEEIADKIKYYHNKKPLGHIFNWNEALSHAQGEYIKIMFSDDWFTYPDSLEKLVNLLEENKKASLAFSGSMQVTLKNFQGQLYTKNAYPRKPEDGYVEKLKKDYRYLFISNQIGAPSDTLYRRMDGITFDEKSNWASDVFLYMEILIRNPIFACTEEPLISIGIHDNQYTESFSDGDERIFKDYEYMFQKYSLQNSQECREYFLKRYLVRYSNGYKAALKNGYGHGEYFRAWCEYYWNEILICYWNAMKRKIRRKK